MTTTGLFRNAADSQTFEAGATIFQAGDPGDLMYVIKSGEVEIEVAGKKVAAIGAEEQQTPQFALQVMQSLVERLRALDESLSSNPSR